MAHIPNTQNKTNGFIDGYFAGNVSANSSELRAHTEMINSSLESLKKLLDKNQNIQKKDELQAVINDFETQTLSIGPSFDEYYNYTVRLSDLMKKLKTLLSIDQLPTDSNDLIKTTIYHFLNIAKTLKEEKIIEEAKKIAILFK